LATVTLTLRLTPPPAPSVTVTPSVWAPSATVRLSQAQEAAAPDAPGAPSTENAYV
jgi:hypothetical protein